jgi:hypothetical protein
MKIKKNFRFGYTVNLRPVTISVLVGIAGIRDHRFIANTPGWDFM